MVITMKTKPLKLSKQQIAKMTLPNLGLWLEGICQAERWISDETLYAVVNIDHIEPGAYAALYAEGNGKELTVTELTEYFPSPQAARFALERKEAQDTQSALLLPDWLNSQFLTDRGAKVWQLFI